MVPVPKLLVVDPDAREGRATAKLCETLGWTVLQATRKDAAVDLFVHEYPSVVLVELLLPDGTGLELIREIRSYDWSHRSKILVHSRIRGSVEIVTQDAKRVGANGVLQKPLVPAALEETAPIAAAFVGREPTRTDARLLKAPGPSAPPIEPEPAEPEERPAAVSTGPPAMPAAIEPLPPPVSNPGSLPFDLPPPGVASAPSGFERDSGEHTTVRLQGLPELMASLGKPAARPSPAVIQGRVESERVLAIIWAALHEGWFGRIRIEAGRNRWSELSVGEGLLWTVACQNLGPGIVDVGFQHGFLRPIGLDELRAALAQRGEQAAMRILSDTGMTASEVADLLELTALERVKTVLELTDGQYFCQSATPPDGHTFEARVSLGLLLCRGLERFYSANRVFQRYASRDRERIYRTRFYEERAPIAAADDYGRRAADELEHGERLAEWMRRHPQNPTALLLLLIKLEALGAVELEGRQPLWDFTLGGAAVGPEPVSVVPSPAAAPVEVERLSAAESVPEAVVAPEPEQDELGEVDPESTMPMTSRELEEQAALFLPEFASGVALEDAGAIAMLQHIVSAAETSAADADSATPVRGESGTSRDPALRRLVIRTALERSDSAAAEAELERWLFDEPASPEAAAWLAWLRFSRALGKDQDGTARALTRLERLVEETPDEAAPLFYMGLAALSLGNLKQARAHLELALALEPEDLWCNAAVALVRAGYYGHPRADLSPHEVWRILRRVMPRDVGVPAGFELLPG